MLKHFKDNAAVLVLNAGLSTVSLVVGLFCLYGLDKIY